MKVKEMIKQLETFNPEARVYTTSYMGEGRDEALCCIAFAHNGDVIIENEHEFDVGEEIEEMLRFYSDNDYDETDAYQEMVDRGYIPDLLDRYYPPEAKDHTMRNYCYEHGIDY